MLITKEVDVTVNSGTVKYYEDKGYIIPRRINNRGRNVIIKGAKITINVEDLKDKSSAFVDVECDGCGKNIKNVRWYNYKRSVTKEGKYSCAKCAHNGHTKWVSFYEWCCINLKEEETKILLSRWDHELNVRNNIKLNFKDISCGSTGFNNKGYWFKCLDHPEHVSEQKNVWSFIRGHGSLTCNQCNTISITHPHLIKFFKNIEDTYQYSYASNKKVFSKCPDCGFEKEIIIFEGVNRGFRCPVCSDYISYPEKFFTKFLQQIKIDFWTQLNKTTLDWCNNYRYDFYFDGIIVETHGEQHYKSGKWSSLKETQDNDNNKEQLAKINNIRKYIVIDCRNSTMKWIKNSIMTSELPTLLNFKEDDIDWLKCHEYACNSLVKEVCMLRNKKLSIVEISEKLQLHKDTVKKYLKQGSLLGWFIYVPKIKNKEIFHKKRKLIICITTGEIFKSQKEAGNKYNLKTIVRISNCCRHKTNSAGKHPITKEPLKWMYHDEYILKSKKEIDEILSNMQSPKIGSVICITTGNIFGSAKEAGKEYKTDRVSISRCCKGTKNSSGKLPDGTPLKWMYYSEYLEQQQNQQQT